MHTESQTHEAESANNLPDQRCKFGIRRVGMASDVGEAQRQCQPHGTSHVKIGQND